MNARELAFGLGLLGFPFAVACGGVVTSSSSGSGTHGTHGAPADAGPHGQPRTQGSDASISNPASCVDDQATEGAACAPEGASCGDCSDIHQFCNELSCQNGTWQAIEVFPVEEDDASAGDDEPDASPPNDSRCPQVWFGSCGLACPSIGLDCWYPGAGGGDALFCESPDAGVGSVDASDFPAGYGVWVCGV